ncbi:MAG: hypothetical protein U9R25_14535 [Chloroflexota bacterium]|nr:hypothetical protein [Chloroflexota bacterium]
MADPQVDKPRYTRILAAELAGVSVQFVEKCEQNELVRVRSEAPGTHCYSILNVRELVRIRDMVEILELDFDTVEVVLNMRSQIVDLRQQIGQLEQELEQREQELLSQVYQMRRRMSLAGSWE